MNYCDRFCEKMRCRSAAFAVMILVVLSAASSGCTGYNFGTAAYDGEKLLFTIDSSENADVTVQVIIYSLGGFRQVEISNTAEDITLESGRTTYVLPIKLESGDYKMHLYVLKDGHRESAQIKDLTV